MYWFVVVVNCCLFVVVDWLLFACSSTRSFVHSFVFVFVAVVVVVNWMPVFVAVIAVITCC